MIVKTEKLALFLKVLRVGLSIDIGTKLAAWFLLASGPVVLVAHQFALDLTWNKTFIGAPQQATLEEAGYGLVAMLGVFVGVLGLAAAPFVAAWQPFLKRFLLLGTAVLGGAFIAQAVADVWAPDLSPRQSMLIRGAGVQTWLAVVIYASRTRYMVLALSVLWAGNAGNLLNAVLLDGVIDFVQINAVGDFIFNFADVFITAGAGLVLLWLPLRALEEIIPMGGWAPSRTFEYTPRPCEPGSRAS